MGALARTGNLSANPLFVDTTYYHLRSNKGNYVGGYFSGGTWAESLETSPGRDAGDPASPFLQEAVPHGGRANLGAYGNTEVASKSGEAGSIFILW